MRDDLPGDGPKNIWLNQRTEAPTMTLKLIQQRSRDLRAKTRRKLLGTLAGPLAASLFYAFGMKEFAPLRQVLQPLFAFALAWSLAGLYFLNRGMWSAVMPGDAGLSTGLEFCRREIERQRDLLRRVLLWSFGPVLLAIGTFILALAMVGTRDRGIFPNGLPFLILIVVWLVGYFIVRLREQRELQREIDELNDIEKENHGL
jgi:FtsH-binding integral membrane protein